jgi:hypothetical protein
LNFCLDDHRRSPYFVTRIEIESQPLYGVGFVVGISDDTRPLGLTTQKRQLREADLLVGIMRKEKQMRRYPLGDIPAGTT